MGISERKEREKERRRNEIVDAAERVFFSKGLGIATMDDVAAEAELSKGTLYLYFKSKEELYLAINLRGLQTLASMFEKGINKCEKGIDKVKAIGEAFYQYSKDYPDYFNALIYFESRLLDIDDQKSKAGLSDIEGHRSLDIVINALNKGIADGSINSEIDPEKTAVILWGQTSGLIQLISLKGEHLRKKHNIDTEGVMNYSFQLVLKMLT